MTDEPQPRYSDFAETRDGRLVALNGDRDRAINDIARALMKEAGGEAAMTAFKVASEFKDEYVHGVVGEAIELYASWVIHHSNVAMLPVWLDRLDSYIRYHRRIAP